MFDYCAWCGAKNEEGKWACRDCAPKYERLSKWFSRIQDQTWWRMEFHGERVVTLKGL